MRHASAELEPWAQLTTGVPAALAAPPAAATLARELAELQGCERATLAPSTLHLFWDLFGLLGGARAAIYMDEGLYAVARWGIERAAARGATVRSFPHHDAESLRQFLRQHAHGRARPIIVTDGFCPGCGQPAPLAEYLELARAFGGHLFMDDTQAIGIFGHAPHDSAPYGTGGGGMLRRLGAAEPNALVVSSLAKGFGVPVAVLAGSRDAVEGFERGSDTRVHCSPPSMAVTRAAAQALILNRKCGDELRLRLAQLVRHFRHCVKAVGFPFIGGLFPVQTLAPSCEINPLRLYQYLLRRGVRTVLRRSRCGQAALLSFIITARHRPDEIERAVDMLAAARMKLEVTLVR